MAGKRVDQVLAELFPDFSRSRLQKWIKDGFVLVDGQKWRPKDNVIGGELVELLVVVDDETQWKAEPVALDIVYEDEQIIVINKPAGLVVHPGAGNSHGTLSNGLLYHAPQTASIPRGGIVHRLDKDTSGLLVAAKTLAAHHGLVEQLQARTVTREYLALCNSVMTAGGMVDAPIGRHPTNRLRMAVRDNGKPAVTHYRVERRFRVHTLVRVNLETGRTHQIRVHMAYIGYPLVGDVVYGGRLKIPPACNQVFANALRNFKRQALHAASLELQHPASGEWMHWRVDMPDDMQELINLAEQDLQQQR
ncbi:MAG: 23S rRNA pseudouridine(1911/1915/1917) synthase RluD [Gammaproteobacteria bacterium]|nr:23S rRNA pseudouridine(1911/1915/1917) synthase RluD [Gammaproteobacteria bacterium]